MSLWELQDQIRRNSLLVPGILLALAAVAVVWHHVFQVGEDFKGMQNFLILLCISMMPLTYVDAKIGSCKDAARVFCMFDHKLIMMHACFLSFRCYSRLYSGDTYVTCINIYGLIISAIALAFNFSVRPIDVTANKDIFAIFGCACVAAVTTQVITKFMGLMHFLSEFYHPAFFSALVETMGEYIEILSFLPAAWMIFRHSNKDGAEVNAEEFKAKALCFTGFAVAFYMVEDVITAFLAFQYSRLESFAHIIHFLLLADFCAFILGLAYNPSLKNSGTFLSRLGGAAMLDQFV
jgi:hypothetical protein